MAVANHISGTIEQMGETAGVIWHFLNEEGPVTLAKLIKDVDLPRDLVMQGLGWLAREGKITIDNSRAKKIGLRSEEPA